MRIKVNSPCKSTVLGISNHLIDFYHLESLLPIGPYCVRGWEDAFGLDFKFTRASKEDFQHGLLMKLYLDTLTGLKEYAHYIALNLCHRVIHTL